LVCPPKMLNDVAYQISEYKRAKFYEFELLKHKQQFEHFANMVNNQKFYCNVNKFLKFVHFFNKNHCSSFFSSSSSSFFLFFFSGFSSSSSSSTSSLLLLSLANLQYSFENASLNSCTLSPINACLVSIGQSS
jgi:hypothetical protein